MIGRVGVCSWSLKPESPADLVRKVQELGLTQVQIALAPLRDGRWKASELRSATDRAKKRRKRSRNAKRARRGARRPRPNS